MIGARLYLVPFLFSAPDINTAAVSTTPAPVIEDKYFARKSDIISVVVDATVRRSFSHSLSLLQTTSPRGRGPDGRMIRDMNPDTIPSPHNSPSPSPTPSPAVEPEHIPDGELDEAEVSRSTIFVNFSLCSLALTLAVDNDMDSSFVTYGRPVSETFTTSELDRLKDPSFVDEMALLEAEAEAENERRQGMKSEPIARPLNRQYRGGRGRGRGGGMEGGVGGGRGAPDSPGMMRRPASPPRNIPVLFGPIVTQDGAQQDPQSDPIRPISPSRFNNNRGPLPPRNIGRPSARPMSMPPKQGNELRARDLLSEPLQSRVKDRDTLLQSAGLDLSDQGGPKNGNKKSQHASMMLGKNPKKVSLTVSLLPSLILKVSASAMFDIESESVDDRSPFQGLRDITRDLDRI